MGGRLRRLRLREEQEAGDGRAEIVPPVWAYGSSIVPQQNAGNEEMVDHSFPATVQVGVPGRLRNRPLAGDEHTRRKVTVTRVLYVTTEGLHRHLVEVRV